MVDRITPEQRSRIMSRIRGRDTTPEILVRQRIFAAGWRFRVCDKRFLGKPDIVVPKARTIIDVRGCFWHRHGCADSTMPRSNVKFWMEKWSKNVKRDRRNEKSWQDAGWNIITVWGCALDGLKRERTLLRICECLNAWAEETADGTKRIRPHRLTLPRLP
ncbi:MAG: DNA mismatch endonuclease Vsr [Lentisphaerae bacterium]|nr:DNA mismatch endonuclease Vsr [Lentisphaerota bacterium]